MNKYATICGICMKLEFFIYLVWENIFIGHFCCIILNGNPLIKKNSDWTTASTIIKLLIVTLLSHSQELKLGVLGHDFSFAINLPCKLQN